MASVMHSWASFQWKQHRAETPALPYQNRYVLRVRNVKVVNLYMVWMLALNNLTLESLGDSSLSSCCMEELLKLFKLEKQLTL